jgi:hypothetical protein
VKKRRRGPNDPVTAEELEWLRKEYNMDHTFRKLSELTGVHRDPVTLAEIPPASEPSPEQKSTETGPMQTGIGPETRLIPERISTKMMPIPEHIDTETGYSSMTKTPANPVSGPLRPGIDIETRPIHSGTSTKMMPIPEHISPETVPIFLHDSVVDLATLRRNPLIVWRQIPQDLLGRLGQIIVGEPCHVDWEAVQNSLQTERITANNRLSLLEIFKEADRVKSFFLFFDFTLLEETLCVAGSTMDRLRNSFKKPNPFVKGIDSVTNRGSFLQLADTFFIRGDRLDLIEKESFLLSPPKEVLGEMNFSREWEAKRQFRYYLAGLPVANSEQDDFLFSLEKRFTPDAWPRRGGLRDVSPLDAPMRNAMQAGTFAIWEIIRGRRPDANDPVRNPVAYLRKCLEKHGGKLLIEVIQKNDLDRWKEFMRIADTAFTGQLHQLDEESLALLANKLGVERRGGAQVSLKEHVEGLEKILEKTKEILKRQIRL